MMRCPPLYSWVFLLIIGLPSEIGQVFADDADIFLHDHFSVICVVAEGVRFNGERDIERGTAFFLTDDGIAVTNSHVALDKKNYKELHIRGMVRRNPVPPVDETEVNLTVLERDTKLDLALLKADKPIPSHYVNVGESRTPIPGTNLTIIGCPLGLGPYLNTAKISNVVDDPAKRWLVEGFINPGMSGSPVFNSIGRVIGITSAGITSGRIDGKPVAIPYPPGIVTPFSMAESGIISKMKIKISRGREIGSSPPLLFSRVITLSDRFGHSSKGAGGGTGKGGGPLASVPETGGDKGFEAETAPIIRQKIFSAAPGYKFVNANVMSQQGKNVRILGAPVISPDKKKITIRYTTTAGIRPDEIATLNASIFADQLKVSSKPAQLQKAFEVYDTNASASADSKSTRTVTFNPEPGYEFSTFRFFQLGREGASEPRLQLSEDRRKLQLSYSLVGNAALGRVTGWLAGTVITTQVLASER